MKGIYLFFISMLVFCTVDAKHKHRPAHGNLPLVYMQPIPIFSLDWVINGNENSQNLIQGFSTNNYKLYYVGGYYYHIDVLNDYIKNHLRAGIAWEPHIAHLICKHAKAGSVVLDVGAHIGTHTLTMAKAVGPEGKVIAFEPQPKIFQELCMNIAVNHVSNVRFFWGAVGEQIGKIELSPLSIGNEAGTGVWGGTGQFVDLTMIDALHLDDVSVIKIDVEGQENRVLEGARETILANKPVILIEIMGGNDFDTASVAIREAILDTIHRLEALGYQVSKICGHDYLAVPNTKT